MNEADDIRRGLALAKTELRAGTYPSGAMLDCLAAIGRAGLGPLAARGTREELRAAVAARLRDTD